ncbi:MAG TPA: glycosyltransferase [Solirubrobacterales bacterium]|nr:glycosyltransferase [Solirubrobacterales bacterium]
MVSLVMPVWNTKPSWLRQAVASALAEDGCEIELIVVDDGSHEPAADLLRDLDDPRLDVVAVPHGGICAARTAGIERARGAAIRFVDSDDVLEPGSTAKLLELSGPDGAISYGDTLVCDDDLRPQKTVGSTVQGDALAECMLGDFSVYITGMLFPRAVVEAVGGFDPSTFPNEDFDYVLRALERAPVRGGGFIASRYRRHHASITGRQSADEVNTRVLERLFDRRPDLRRSKLGRRALSRLHLRAATRMTEAGRPVPSARYLGAAFRYSPRSAAREAIGVAAGLPRGVARRLIVAGRGAS